MPLSVFSLMLVVFSFTTGEFVISGILPEVADDLSVSVPSAGLLATAYAVGMIVGGPVVTVLTARVGRRPLIAGLVTVSVLGNLGSALAPDYSLLLLSRVVAGLVVATFFAVAITTAVSVAPPGKEAAGVANVTLGLNLGIILGAPLGTFIGQRFGWQATFLAIAALSTAALLLALPTVPAGHGSAGHGSAGHGIAGDGIAGDGSAAKPAASVLGELRVLARRDVQLAIGLTVLGNAGIVMVFTYIAPLLTDVGGFGAGAVPVLLLVYGAGAVIGNFLGGRLADRALMPSLAWLLAALTGALVLFRAVGGVPALAVVMVFVLGLLAFAIIPGMQTRVMTAGAAGAAPTLAVAVNASGFQLAAAFAGWLGGRVIDDGPGLRSLPLVGALLTVAGLAVALRLVRHDRRSAATTPSGTPSTAPSATPSATGELR